MEVELGLDPVNVGDDGVSGIVTTGASSADVHLTTEDIGELALALVAPLGSEQDGSLASRPGVGWFWHCSHDDMRGERVDVSQRKQSW